MSSVTLHSLVRPQQEIQSDCEEAIARGVPEQIVNELSKLGIAYFSLPELPIPSFVDIRYQYPFSRYVEDSLSAEKLPCSVMRYDNKTQALTDEKIAKIFGLIIRLPNDEPYHSAPCIRYADSKNDPAAVGYVIENIKEIISSEVR